VSSNAIAWLSCLVLVGCAEDEIVALRSAALANAGATVGTYRSYVARGDDGSSWLLHRVVIDGVPRTLAFDDAPPWIPPNSTVRVWGDEHDGTIAVEDLEIVGPPPAPLVDADPYAPRKLAAVILHWGETAYTKEEVEDRLFDAEDSTRNYYAEISYGKEAMTGDVFGPYQVQYQGCDTDWIAYAAHDQLQLAGIDPSTYDQFMYIFPEVGCGWSGLAMLGYPNDPAQDSWYNGSFNCVVRNQELAHNYGLMHTRYYYGCGGDAPFSSNCTYEEYGSPYDPMGYGCGHMVTANKEYMGWLEGCNVVTATADGTFNILPSEVPCNGTQALRVPTFDGRYYYIEYRQRIGFDALQEDGFGGVLVHVSQPSESEWDGGPYAYLIDLGVGGFLGEGESYADPGGTVTMTVDELHDTHAVVSVVMPGAPAADPTCLDGAAPDEQAGVWGSLECTGGPFVPDASPPMVSFMQPQDGAAFAPGDDARIVVNASDDVLVNSVSLYVDDQLAGTSTQPPWEWTLPVVGEGTFELVAVASDGIHEGEASITIHVGDAPGAESGNASDAASDDGASPGSSEGGVEDDDVDPIEDDALPPGFGGEPAEGCGCRSSSAPPPLWLLVLVTGARALRRTSSRRRC
jgi:MYXO-CTERM domain-containing protein